jgi:hypothetical protein
MRITTCWIFGPPGVGDADGATGGVVLPPPDDELQPAAANAVAAKQYNKRREIFKRVPLSR